MRLIRQLSSRWSNPKKSIGRQNHVDNAFLPAALEILETPASPIRIAFIWFICLLASGTLLWTWFGTFDIVATAQGKIQPTGRVKIIQSLEAGRTRSVAVHNGISVRAGDVLVELDDTEILAEERAALSGLQAFRAEATRRQAFLNTVSGVGTRFAKNRTLRPNGA